MKISKKYEGKIWHVFENEDEFIKLAHKKIDCFIKLLYDSMSANLICSNRAALLCNSIQNTLKKNILTENEYLFDFLCHILNSIEEIGDDCGLYPDFSYSYADDLLAFAKGNDLIVQVIFCSGCDDMETMPIFQIRFHYEQEHGGYNNKFDEYIKSKNFLTKEDMKKHNPYDEDQLCITIAKLYYCCLKENLYEKNEIDGVIHKFKKKIKA